MGREMEGLLVVLLFVGLISSTESVRTHERFAQTAYYANPNSLNPTLTPDDAKYTKEETPIVGKESKEESKKDFIPADGTQQPGESKPERQKTYPSGDFTADARPWWVNPEYQNYGDSQTTVGKPYTDRYPSTFDPRYFKNYQRSRGSFSQYVKYQEPGNYPQYTKMNNDASFEPSGGGCPTDYWVSNTQRWPAFFNTKSTIGDAFGTPAVQVYGKTTILQALLDTHDDGYHSLARNGCTALLNSYTRSQYKFSHQNVIESFNAALISNKVAARQAASFDEANVSAYSQQQNSCV